MCISGDSERRTRRSISLTSGRSSHAATGAPKPCWSVAGRHPAIDPSRRLQARTSRSLGRVGQTAELTGRSRRVPRRGRASEPPGRAPLRPGQPWQECHLGDSSGGRSRPRDRGRRFRFRAGRADRGAASHRHLHVLRGGVDLVRYEGDMPIERITEALVEAYPLAFVQGACHASL